MNRNAVAVFGVIREADEPWVASYEISIRARLPKGVVARALVDLCKLGLIVRHCERRQRYYAVNHAALPR